MIKKVIACVLSAAMILSGFQIPQAGATTVIAKAAEEFEFQDGAIKSYNGSSKYITIPDRIDGTAVREISAGAFKNKRIKGVIIPEGITTIGESAFEGHDLSMLHIPESVISIGESAFKRADYDVAGLQVTGMGGITRLENYSFGNIQPLSIEVPVLTELNPDAFEPMNNLASARYYVELYTRNNENVYGLSSYGGRVLIDPYTATIRCIVRETGQILQTKRIVDVTGGEHFLSGKEMSDFLIKDSEVDVATILIDGYICENSDEKINITNVNTVVDRYYKPYKIDAPVEISRNESSIKGYTFPNAEVTVTRLRKGSYFTEEMDSQTVQANWEGEFTADVNLSEECIGLKLQASVTNGSGIPFRSNAAYCAVGSTTKNLMRLPVFEDLHLKQYTSIPYKRQVTLEFSDGSNDTDAFVDWNGGNSVALKAGVDWRSGIIEYEVKTDSRVKLGTNKYPVAQKLIVENNEGGKPADTESLSTALDKARALINTTYVSQDGKELDRTVMWVRQDVMDRLQAAKQVAEAFFKSVPTEQTKVDEMAAMLQAACSEFMALRTPGTKNNEEVPTAETKRVNISVSFSEEIAPSNYDSIQISLKNRYKDKVYSNPVKATTTVENERVLTFNDVALGAYRLEVEGGYVFTDAEYRRAGRDKTELSIEKNYLEEGRHRIHLKKGIEVTFIAGEHGELEGSRTIYYLHNERLMNYSHHSSLELPMPKPNPNYRFKGWSINEQILSNEEQESYVITQPVTIKAVFEPAGNAGIDINTPIKNEWVLGDFEYGTDTEGYSTVKGLSTAGKMKVQRNINIALPDVNPYTKQKVKTIDFDAFKDLSLNSVSIPEGIVYIRPSAFENNDIVHISFPSTLEIIGNFAFKNNKLRELSLNEGLKNIMSGVFWENQIETVRMPKSLNLIASFAFLENKLTNIELNEGLLEIGDRALAENDLTVVNIPFSLEKLHDNALDKNRGLSKYQGKVGLFTPDKKSNPKNLRDGVGYVINPDISSGINIDRTGLKKLTLIATKLRNALNFSDDASAVARNEKYIGTALGKRVEDAIYEGHYAYYDKSILEDSNSGRSVNKAMNELNAVIELMKTQEKQGTGAARSYTEFRMVVGIPGISLEGEVEGFEMVMEPVGEHNRRAYKPAKLSEVTPHTAWFTYEAPVGRFRFVPDVGYCLTATYNGVEQKDRNPYIEIPKDIQNGAFTGFGFGATEGRVLIFDLGEHGTTNDKRVETVMKADYSTDAPRVTANPGYIFRGWSLNGKDVIALDSFKVYNDLILYAVYEKGTAPTEPLKTQELDKALEKAEAAKKDVKSSRTGTDVAENEYWVPVSIMEQYDYEIGLARNIKKTAIRQDEVDKAVQRLNDAVNAFNKAKQRGVKKDAKSELRAVYVNALYIKDTTKVSTVGGADIEPTELYVTENDAKAFERKLVEASWQLDDDDAMDADIKRAKEELERAVAVFANARRNGTKKITGGSGSTGAETGGGSYSGGYSGGSFASLDNTISDLKRIADKVVTIQDEKTPLSSADRLLLNGLLKDVSAYRLKDLRAKGFKEFVKSYGRLSKLMSKGGSDNVALNKALIQLSKGLVKIVSIDINKVKTSNFKGTEKEKLYALVKKVEMYSIDKYDTKTIINIFGRYEKALKVLNNKKADSKQINEAYKQLLQAVNSVKKTAK